MGKRTWPTAEADGGLGLADQWLSSPGIAQLASEDEPYERFRQDLHGFSKCPRYLYAPTFKSLCQTLEH